MKARLQVLEAELKTVRVVGLSRDNDVARAANKREQELRAELQQIRIRHPLLEPPSATPSPAET